MSKKIFKIFLSLFLFFVSVFIYRLIYWVDSYFANLTFSKIIFHLMIPIEGTDEAIIYDAIKYSLIPSFILTILVVTFIYINQKSAINYYINIKNKRRNTLIDKVKSLKIKIWPIKYPLKVTIVFSILIFSMAIYQGNKKFGLADYLSDQYNKSNFIEDNYIKPEQSILKFPDKKQNLIYIFLESMENTYADINSGGAFKENYILN